MWTSQQLSYSSTADMKLFIPCYTKSLLFVCQA